MDDKVSNPSKRVGVKGSKVLGFGNILLILESVCVDMLRCRCVCDVYRFKQVFSPIKLNLAKYQDNVFGI